MEARSVEQTLEGAEVGWLPLPGLSRRGEGRVAVEIAWNEARTAPWQQTRSVMPDAFHEHAVTFLSRSQGGDYFPTFLPNNLHLTARAKFLLFL